MSVNTNANYGKLASLLAHEHLRYDGEGDRADLGSYEMCGTERLWEFVLLLATPLGFIGIREYRPSKYRIRVVPANAEAAAALKSHFDGFWKQPEPHGENRFSIVPRDPDHQIAALLTGFGALLSGQDKNCFLVNTRLREDGLGATLAEALTRAGVVTVPVEDNTPPNYEALEIADLVKEVRSRKLRGCNGASRWGKAALVAALRRDDTESS